MYSKQSFVTFPNLYYSLLHQGVNCLQTACIAFLSLIRTYIKICAHLKPFTL